MVRAIPFIAAACIAAPWAGAAFATDAEAARALAEQNDCLACHGVGASDGPAFSQVAEKYKGKPDAQKRLLTRIKAGGKVRFPDGHEEAHKAVKVSSPKDKVPLDNLVQWILAQ